MQLPIYMDNMATTIVDPRVLDAMLPYFADRFGNAASRNHSFGWEAEDAVLSARAQIASSIGAEPEEIIFTSGATESDNLALKGVFEACQTSGFHVVTAPTEHKAILDTCHYLQSRGCRITLLPVDSQGIIDPETLRAVLTGEPTLVSIMLSNNEIGVIQPISELAAVAHQAGAFFHTDAAQAVGKVPVDVRSLGIDLMSLTAHKVYGPKGIGALYVRRNCSFELAAQMHGGGHEGNMRSGTLNVPGIVGLGKACTLAARLLPVESARLESLRRRLWEHLSQELPVVQINGHPTQRLPGNLNVCFAGVDAEAVLTDLEDIALSPGAACTSGSVKPSYVLKALGLSNQQARSSIRFGLGRFNTVEEVDYASARVIETVRRLREVSPLWETTTAENTLHFAEVGAES